MYFVTPFRNGLTLGATNTKASAMELYGQVFAKGFRGGWTGGIYPAIAACPQFLCLGPAYHFFHSFSGVTGGVVLASCMETAIVYGAETCNAQMAANAKTPGRIANVQSAYKPWGPGVGIHAFRNIIATAGLRMFCTPCTDGIESITGKKNALTQLCGDFSGNVVAACLSAPVHQLYGFTVSTPELQQLSGSDRRARMIQFLKDQYLETKNGRVRFTATVPRDLFMRSMYVAVEYTMFSTLERTLIKVWPR
eukprot:SRR837773.25628.p1 GENE.SRR837773.25628~~SRR837773.25628.p1  ORF type:complete len:276 (+),score=73.04 SRR837773.25628:77-829(+)